MKSDKKTSVRLSSQQMADLDEICKKNGNRSRGNIIREAINLVTKGTSEIPFEMTKKMDNSDKPTEIIKAEKEKTHTNCPHCLGKLHIEANLDSSNEVVLPSFIPGYRCGIEGCNELHPNPNYKNRVVAYCSRCGQFAKTTKGPCPWCRYLDTLKLVDQNRLDQIGVPRP